MAGWSISVRIFNGGFEVTLDEHQIGHLPPASAVVSAWAVSTDDRTSVRLIFTSVPWC